MKNTRVVKAAFSTCILFSLLIGTVLLFNIKAIPKYRLLIDSGKQIIDLLSKLKLLEKHYLLHLQHDVLDDVKDNLDKIREKLAFYEKSGFADNQPKLGTLKKIIIPKCRCCDHLAGIFRHI